MEALQTALPNEIHAVMAKSAYWNNVRVARQQLGRHLKITLDPNYEIPEAVHWVHVTAIADGEVSIIGSDRKALRTFECSVENAARVIASHTHRLASEKEIEAFLMDRLKREETCAKEEERVNPNVSAQRASRESTVALTKAAEAIYASTVAKKGKDN